MKYGVIAHVNGDLVALKAALRTMESHEVALVVCAGNVLGKPVHADKCADILREWGFPTVIGDFDAAACGRGEPWGFEPKHVARALTNRECLSDKNRIWMEGLPTGLLFDDFAVVHGSAGASRVYKNKWAYLMEYWPFPDREQGKICFIAHPDTPGIYASEGELLLDDGGKLIVDPDYNIFIAPGRVGRLSLRDPWSTFGIFDTEARSYQQIHLNLDRE